jgi:hypothetical protein
MFGDIPLILGRVKLDLHINFVHPLNQSRNKFCAPEKLT